MAAASTQSMGLPPTDRTDTRGRLVWLDSLRGLAALAVVVFHLDLVASITGSRWFAEHISLGIAGVMTFFLISGYIIPASLERRGDLAEFWIGRVFRIYPLIIVVVAIMTFVGHTELKGPTGQGWELLGNLTLWHEFLGVHSAIGVLWTLAYEMLFYALTGALFVLKANQASAAHALGWCLAAVALGSWWPAHIWPLDSGVVGPRPLIVLALVSLTLGIALILTGHLKLGSMIIVVPNLALMIMNARVPFYESALILATMFAGTAIFRAESGQMRAKSSFLAAGTVAIAGFVTIAFYTDDDAAVRSETFTWQAFAFGYGAAWVVFGIGWLFRKKIWPGFLTWLGRISYSVYIVHIPIIWLTPYLLRRLEIGPETITWPILVAEIPIILATAALTYRFVEQLGQRVGRSLIQRRRTRGGIAKVVRTEPT